MPRLSIIWYENWTYKRQQFVQISPNIVKQSAGLSPDPWLIVLDSVADPKPLISDPDPDPTWRAITDPTLD